MVTLGRAIARVGDGLQLIATFLWTVGERIEDGH